MMSPVWSSGTTTSSSTIGSSNATPAAAAASRNAIEPAIWNDMSEESTVWNFPSTSVTRMSTIGYPAATPSDIGFTTPFSTLGMNWFGMMPPTILSTYSNPAPCSSGSTSIVATPYCPCPPDCFT